MYRLGLTSRSALLRSSRLAAAGGPFCQPAIASLAVRKASTNVFPPREDDRSAAARAAKLTTAAAASSAASNSNSSIARSAGASLASSLNSGTSGASSTPREPPQSPVPPPPPRASRSSRPGILSTLVLITGGIAFFAYYHDTRSAIHEHVIMPLIRNRLDAEESHKAAVRMLAMKGIAGSLLRPTDHGEDGEELKVKIWDLELSNPVGVAAGFDKDAEAIDGLFDLGFGYVEVGSITPEPQPGNPKPRFFRLEEDQACINRYGFNSLGHRQALHQLQARVRDFAVNHPSLFPNPLPLNPLPPAGIPRSLRPGKLLAINLGKNKKSSADSNDDYVKGVQMFGPYADVLVVNVSSPNTPGLRGLQGKDFLGRLLGEVVHERDSLPLEDSMKPKVVVKIAPDLDEQEIEDIASAVRDSRIDGVIVSNTTVRREGLGLKSRYAKEVGGLSGAPVKPLSILALSTLRALLPPSTPIIGCGGISNGQDAMEFVKAGASFVQAYTAFGYTGVGFPRKLKDELTEELNKEGTTWSNMVVEGQKRWRDGLEKVQRELQLEASKLKETLAGSALIPKEDIAAEKGSESSSQAQLIADVPTAANTVSQQRGSESRLLTADEISRLLNQSLDSRTSSTGNESDQPDTQQLVNAAEEQLPTSPAPTGDAIVKVASVLALAGVSGRMVCSSGGRQLLRILRPVRRSPTTVAPSRRLPFNRRFANNAAPPSTASPGEPNTLSGRLKELFKRYGRHAIGVYLLLSAVDLSVAFVIVHLAGADKIEKGEQWILAKYRQIIKGGEPEKSLGEQASQIAQEAFDKTKEVAGAVIDGAVNATTSEVTDKPKSRTNHSLFWAEFALAYTIHKTLFLPVRVGLTAAWTPKIVNWLTRRGWIGKGGVKRAAAHAQDKVKEASKRVQDNLRQ